MREIGAFEAKNKLGHLLDLVERGEEITITRHGKQIALSLASTERKPGLQCVASGSARSSTNSAGSIGPSGRPSAIKDGHEFGAR